jgi:hypothetical protein
MLSGAALFHSSVVASYKERSCHDMPRASIPVLEILDSDEKSDFDHILSTNNTSGAHSVDDTGLAPNGHVTWEDLEKEERGSEGKPFLKGPTMSHKISLPKESNVSVVVVESTSDGDQEDRENSLSFKVPRLSRRSLPKSPPPLFLCRIHGLLYGGTAKAPNSPW